MNRWPWTDLVSAVKRHCGSIEGWKVLELGCGASVPNRQFFTEEGAYYWGVDTALEHENAHAIPELGWIWRVETMDFTKETPEGPFDLICDRAAVTHNTTEDIKNTLRMAYDALKPGGWYIGIDWFGDEHGSAKCGDEVDPHTRTNIKEGQFAGVGIVHFTDGAEIEELFHTMEMVQLRHKKWATLFPPETFASWDIVARRPE